MSKQIKIGYVVFKMFENEQTETTVPVGVSYWDEDLEKWEMKITPDILFVELLSDKIYNWAKERRVPYYQEELLPWTSAFWEAVQSIMTTGIISTTPRATIRTNATKLFSEIVETNLIPRLPVRWFANRMELKLRDNEYKGGWSGCSDEYLLNRLLDEVNELFVSVGEGNTNYIINEAVDVANFAMMIADKHNVKGSDK